MHSSVVKTIVLIEMASSAVAPLMVLTAEEKIEMRIVSYCVIVLRRFADNDYLTPGDCGPRRLTGALSGVISWD